MNKNLAASHNLVDLASRYIHFVEPGIIGVAFMELDCNCIKLLGIHADGRTAFPVTLVLAKPAYSAHHPPRCRICSNDKGLNVKRLVRYGIIWILLKKRKPGRKLRRVIARKLFGPGYGAAEFAKLGIGP